jgi:nitrite reductase (NO-forming)
MDKGPTETTGIATGPATPRGAAGRVVTVQRQARTTLGLAGVFALAAGLVLTVPHRTGEWLPLHLFLAGTLLLAISAATQLFAVTWAAGPPPSDRLAATQRWLLATGVALFASARELQWPSWWVVVGGALVIAALVVLAISVSMTVTRGVQRRFDAARRAYLLAFVAGLGGCAIGIAMATGIGAPMQHRARAAHLTLNLLGLVGLVIVGTLPFFTATQARLKMSTRATARAQTVLLASFAIALGASTTGFLLAVQAVATLGLAAYAAGLLGLVSLLPLVRAKQLRWAGPRLLQLAAGVAWWFGTTIALAWQAGRGEEVFTRTVIEVLVVGGYTQILVAAIAYLGPVLRGGGHQQLAAGFRATRSWVGLGAANAAAIALLFGPAPVAVAALLLWLIDTAVRVAVLVRGAASAGALHRATETP